MTRIDLNPNAVTVLKNRIANKRAEWKETQEEFMRPAYEEAGNHLRTLQNAGLSISQLSTYWGTTNRNTIYNFLDYATTPYVEPEKSNKAKAKAKTRAKEAPKPKKLEAYLFREPTENPDHYRIKTVTPVPVEAWPHHLNPNLNWPTEPWEGEAEWDETGLLMTPQGMPLHLAQKTLGGMKKLLAEV